MKEYTDFVGVDISKDRLDVHVRSTGKAFFVANTQSAATKMLKRFGPHVAFACEASGGYERALLCAANSLGCPIYRLHPADVRAFARLRGKRAKTDPLDAQLIAAAAATAVECRHPVQLDESAEDLRDLMILRDRCIEDIKVWRGHVTRMRGQGLRFAKARLRSAEGAKHSANKQIKKHIADHKTMACKAARIATVPGAGPVLAATLCAFFPELGTMSGRRAASLTGVAPHPRQSGAGQGYNRCMAGRARVRRVLYMAALSVARSGNTPFAICYKNLREQGKPHKVALVAVMRRMIVAINTILKEQRDWRVQ